MTSKRRRRARRRAGRPASTTSPEAEAAPQHRAASRPGAKALSPFPPFRTSLARGLWSVAAAPPTLAWTFVSLLVTWAVFVSLGEAPTPSLLAVLLSVSPAHLLADLPVAFGAGGGVAILVALAVLGLVRAVTFGFLILLIQGWLETGRAELRPALRRLPAALSGLFTVLLVEAAAMYALLSVAGGFLGPLAPLTVVAALYFLAFVPVVAAVDGGSLQESFRRGFRAARLPGTSHLTLVMAYFLLFFYAASVSPFGIVTSATPGPLEWAFALMVSLVHAGVLGSLVFRWLAVRDQVSGGPAPRRGSS
ncbi:MAG: hypothetical protein ACRDIW_00810 [Actinomycetota bacterium]